MCVCVCLPKCMVQSILNKTVSVHTCWIELKAALSPEQRSGVHTSYLSEVGARAAFYTAHLSLETHLTPPPSSDMHTKRALCSLTESYYRSTSANEQPLDLIMWFKKKRKIFFYEVLCLISGGKKQVNVYLLIEIWLDTTPISSSRPLLFE